MIDAFDLARTMVNGKLDLLCPKMELLECPGYHRTAMSGCGVIRTNERGGLSFRLSGSIAYPYPEVFRGDRPKGSLYEATDHVMLVALDHEGREWRSNPLLIHPLMLGDGHREYVSHNVESLLHSRKRSRTDQSTVRMYLPRQPALPFDQFTRFERLAGEALVDRGWSIDHHIRRIGDAEVAFRREEDGWLSVTAKQATPIMPDWAGLMCHALAFATCGVARPAVIVRSFNDREDVGLFSGPYLQYQSFMPRPIDGLSSDSAEDFWSLVERVFLFAWSRRHNSMQFLEELDAIRAGAASSIQTACLTVAIGIESLANHLLPEVPPPSWDPGARASLETHIKSWNGDAATRERLLGWLQSKGQPRAVDRLFAWANREGVEHALVGHWSALRNQRAHGVSLVYAQPSFDRYYSVVELLYRLVASVVGFDGEVLKTSIRGWGKDDSLADPVRSLEMDPEVSPPSPESA